MPAEPDAAAAGAPDLPPAPGYGNRSVAEVLSSAAAAAAVPGFSNALGLPPARRVCVVMVDGLGSSLLRQRAGHAPFLRAAASTAGRTLSAAFPSTTAASLASLGTGLAPGRHGMVGYDVLAPELDRVVNQLGGWDPDVDPAVWQPHPTVLERAQEHIPTVTVSLPRFADSPMTRAALRGGRFVRAEGTHARVAAAAEELASEKRMLMYLYWNELDKAGHRYGSQSGRWGDQLEELDGALRTLVRRVPSDTLVLLTADHGMLDVQARDRHDFSAVPELVDGVRHTAGEPRMLHLYLEPDLPAGHGQKLLAAWQRAYGNKAWIFTREQALAAGLFGPVTDPAVAARIGDIMVAAREPIALFDMRRQPPGALDMVGYHGSLTRAERDVPLLTLNAPGRS